MANQSRAAADKAKKPMLCKAPDCGLPVTWAQRSGGEMVWTGIGPMHASCNRAMTAKIGRMIQGAIRDGTHSKAGKWVCAWCRQWVEGGIFHRTLDGESVCLPCCYKAGMVNKDGTEKRTAPPDIDELRV